MKSDSAARLVPSGCAPEHSDLLEGQPLQPCERVYLNVHRVTISQFASMLMDEAKRYRTLNNKNRMGLGNIKMIQDVTGYHHTVFYSARKKGGAAFLSKALILLQACAR